MSERLTLIVGEYTISKLRSGEAVEFDNSATLLPASDLATNDALRAENERLRANLEKARGIAKGFWLDYPFAHITDADAVCGICEGIADAIAALSTHAPPRVEEPGG